MSLFAVREGRNCQFVKSEAVCLFLDLTGLICSGRRLSGWETESKFEKSDSSSSRFHFNFSMNMDIHQNERYISKGAQIA